MRGWAITFTNAAGGTDGGSQILLVQTSALGPAPSSVAFGTARM